MKKLLSLILLAALLVVCTACSSGTKEAEQTTAPTEAATEEAAQETEAESTEAAGEPTEEAAEEPADEAADEAAEEAVETAASEGSGAFTWQIELRGAEVKESLHTDAGVPQYDGEVLDVAFDNEPAEGCSFLILTLTVTKSAAGGGAFDWDKLTVVDENGNAYNRMENDSFLDSHAYRRMAGTSLQIGENKGSICFEIPTEVASGKLVLNYDAGDEGINSIEIQ